MSSPFLSQPSSSSERARSTSVEVAMPEILGWRLLSRLGGGMLTDVYAATTAGMPEGEPPAYAVKALKKTSEMEAEALVALRHEALAGTAIKCPHVIPVLAASLKEPPYYLVMPLVRGVSLEALLRTKVRPALPAILWIARQVAEAVAAMQATGWLHNDIKPSNILVAPSGHVTLLDLGFARRLEACKSDPRDQPFLGTLCYCAPELLTSRLRADTRSDLYSLAVVLYEMLVRTVPFDSHDAVEVVRRHREEKPLDVRIVAPHLPARVARLINQMLAKDPLRRVQTAAEVVERLASLEIETFSQRSLLNASL